MAPLLPVLIISAIGLLLLPHESSPGDAGEKVKPKRERKPRAQKRERKESASDAPSERVAAPSGNQPASSPAETEDAPAIAEQSEAPAASADTLETPKEEQ